MKYDFTSVIDRRGKDAMAVDAVGKFPGLMAPEDGFDFIPMWVADMNFATVPTVQSAVAERLAHPTFGYFITRNEYYQAIMDWQEKRNAVKGLRKECIGYENGVLGGVVSALNAFATPGDAILVHSPTSVSYTHLTLPTN